MAEPGDLGGAAFAAFPASACIVDATGQVIRSNDAWTALAHNGGLVERRLAQDPNYLAACRAVAAGGVQEAAQFVDRFEALRQRDAGDFQVAYAGHAGAGHAGFAVRAARLPGESHACFLITHAPASAAAAVPAVGRGTHDPGAPHADRHGQDGNIGPRATRPEEPGPEESVCHEAEAETAKLAERLVRTLESVTDAFFALDASLAFSYVNAQAESLLQTPRTELIGRNIWEAFPAAVGTVFEEQYRHAALTGEPVEFVAHYPPLSRWFEVRAFPAEGGLTVYFRDVTERRAAQQALEHSEQSLRLAIRASGLGTWSWDKQRSRIHWSDDCARMFGASAGGSIEYRDFLMLVNEEERNHKDITFRNVLEREQEFRVDLRARTPAGDIRWLSVLGRMFPSDQEHGGSMQGVAFDITDQKNAEGELRRLNERLESSVGRRTAELEKATLEAESANRAKSAFLASMSHEIRTPMNGVLGMVEVLAQSELGSRQSEALKTIHDSANSLLRLIDDILDFSKIEAGRLEIEKQATSLETLADSVCQTLNAEALAKGVTVNVYVSPSLPGQVMADPLRLRQVFFNLLGNAI